MLPKLLIVDDEPSARDSVRRTLNKDFEILEADGAEKAFEVLKKTADVAVIISDEKMPGKSGVEFLSEIKLHYPKIVRVILSGQIDIEQMMSAVNKAEVHRFILKPWENYILRLQMQEALLHHRDLEEMVKLQKLAITDPITGLSNHRFFQERLREEVERCQRHNREFSLMMMDVDFFKPFNDKLGHPQGDRVLSEVAKLLKTVTRTADSVSRYGGDEFAMILPETTKEKARDVAERIRRDLATLSNNKELPTITLSFGIAAFPKSGTKPDEIVKNADAALYRAKSLGRDRIEIHE